MIKKIMNIIALLIVTGGVILICYPSFSSYINDKFAYKDVEKYKNQVEEYSKDKVNKMLDMASAYNLSLPKSYPVDPFSKQNVSDISGTEFENFSMLQDGTMLGYVEIPVIDVYLPVYYGTSSKVLKDGLGLVENSSLPVGGKGTHAVISGHTGMASKKMLTDLNLVKKGDLFFVHVLNKDFAYQVNQIKVVLPENTEDLLIEEDKDYVTLLTCTPFGINDHRLLVRGERISYNFSNENEYTITPEVAINKYLWLLVLGSIIFIILVIVFVKYIKRHGKKGGTKKQ